MFYFHYFSYQCFNRDEKYLFHNDDCNTITILGTFTISNLGMFGVGQFDAILPPGTGSILAIAASTPKVVQLKNGHFGVQKSMTVTITCDHRHIYGADAAEFLRDLAGSCVCDILLIHIYSFF